MNSLLAVDGVSVAFGGLRVLSGMSLDVPQGSIVGLIGPNGAGKTTLFNVISGFQHPISGRVRFRGEDVTRLAPFQRARLGIGRSFQNLGLMTDQTVETNLLAAQFLHAGYSALDPLVRPWRRWSAERELGDRVDEVLARFRLDGYRCETVANLSFGVARFVELASVLVLAPDLLLLDEPTTGLDAAETARLLASLRLLREEGKTVLLVAHNVAFVMEVCDWVYVLAGGKLLAEGEAADVQRDPAVVDAYLGRVHA